MTNCFHLLKRRFKGLLSKKIVFSIEMLKHNLDGVVREECFAIKDIPFLPVPCPLTREIPFLCLPASGLSFHQPWPPF